MKSLAICAIVRNEAPYIAEWIAFHRLVGVSRFYLYDDRSTDRTLDVLRDVDRGDVTIHPYTEGWHSPEYYGIPNDTIPWYTTPQACAFRHFARRHKGEVKWCAFIDVDEFLFHTADEWLPDVLHCFRTSSGVVVNWLVFGSNGHKTRPSGLTIENYTRRAQLGEPAPYGSHVKTIVRMCKSHRWGPNGSHCPVFDDASEPMTQDGEWNPWSMTPCPTRYGLRINHYLHRSAEEADAKARGGDNNAPPWYQGYTERRERIALHDRNEEEDREILRFLPALKREMGLPCD